MSGSGLQLPASREIRELLRPHPALGFPCPDYNGRTIANIPASILQALPGRTNPVSPLLPPLVPSRDPFGGRRARGPVVLFLVDGLGWQSFRAWAASAGELGRQWALRSRPISTVFPTTTTAALVSLSSGVAPGTHGLVGYRQYLPRFGVVADMLRMSPVGVPGSDLLVHRGFRPSHVAGAPTLFRRGVKGVAVSRDRFQGSGFTRILYDGASYVPYATGADLAHEMVRLLERDRPPSLIYAYWDELDTIQHLKGPEEADLFGLELGRVAALVEWISDHLPRKRVRDTSLLVTGDHGQVPAGPSNQLRVDRWPDVAREMAHPLGGDRRAGFFAAKPGRVEALDTALRRRLPPSSRLVRMDDALGAGAFGPGPYHPEISARLGDLLALVPAPWGLRDFAPGAPAPTRHLFGAHGGVDPREFLVPLIAGPLSEFSRDPSAPTRRQQR